MSVFVDRKEVEAAMDTAGLSPESLQADYSGRGMYGSGCLGIVCDLGEILMFAAALALLADEVDWIDGARSDSMGVSSIWYWPNVRLEEES